MAFKFFQKLLSLPEEPRAVASDRTWYQEIVSLPQVKRTERRGMDKNFRVGRVKHVSADRTKMLIGVVEMCHQEDGKIYEAGYNMWVNFDKEWKAVVSKGLKDKWVVFGFYMQSFRNIELSDAFDNVFTCRFINLIPTEEQAKSLAIDLSESRLFVDHPFLKLSNVNFKL